MIREFQYTSAIFLPNNKFSCITEEKEKKIKLY